ncbi:hypothetical protein F183_A54740 (plasmid) [Bryobacterales bacterium F-183]|nr:hypothetical protein F183_A54740 [Bryobacterales bacterium F-183]
MSDLQRHLLGLWLEENRQRYLPLPERISFRAVDRLAKVYAQLRPQGPALPTAIVQEAVAGLTHRLSNREPDSKNPIDFWKELTQRQIEGVTVKLQVKSIGEYEAADPNAVLIARSQASNAFAERTYRELLRELEPEKKNPDDLYSLLESLSAVIQVQPVTQYLSVASNLAYQALRDVVAKQQFREIPDSPWPTAILQRDGAVGIAQLRPIEADDPFPLEPERKQRLVELMWSQRAELSDLDADVLDLLSAIWLQQARTPNDPALVTVDECLRLRGLAPKMGGAGRRGGYTSKQREEFLYALGRIESTWLKMSEIETYTAKGRPQKTAIESRAFVMTTRLGQMRLDGRMDIQQFIFRPGDIFSRFLFGPGRQTALLSAKAVQYDYYRHKWEKRLTRYLSWLWRINAANQGGVTAPLKVSTLLDCVGQAETHPRFPNRVRERLEKALDTLKEDSVISAWQYERTAEAELEQQQNWYPLWLRWTVSIQPPPEILSHYKSLGPGRDAAANPGAGGQGGASKATIGQRLRARREALQLSQAAAAEQIGIDRSLLSRIEQDKRNPSQNDLTKIERWLGESGEPGDPAAAEIARHAGG